jgi:hypothetical protein
LFKNFNGRGIRIRFEGELFWSQQQGSDHAV